MKQVIRNKKLCMKKNTKHKERNRATGEDITCLKSHRWYLSNWYNNNPGRLLAEKKDMNERFPDFELHKIDNELAWMGTVKPKGHNANTYKIAIKYPKDYPNKPPVTFVIEPEVRSVRHKYSNGSLDLMYPGDHIYTDKTTAVQTVAMAVTWLYCYEYHAKHCPDGINCSRNPCPYWLGTEALY